MRIALITHPPFMASQSMPRFAEALRAAYEERGHEVSMHTARPVVVSRFAKTRWAKWAGYIDLFLIFPREFRRLANSLPHDTLFVFCDQALGPWCPVVADRPHIVHAHDLLALRSALGLIPENPTSLTGRIYQRYIRWGFRHAKRFIAVSGRTQADLGTYAGIPETSITVVHNELNAPFAPVPEEAASRCLQDAGLPHTRGGFLLHVGGGQWYKNTDGIVALYASYVRRCEAHGKTPLPLVMVTPRQVSAAVDEALAQVPASGSVLFRPKQSSEVLRAAYSLCAVFLFPSLAEGFGWPIVEAQACGTLVLTTDDSPMNEIGGPAAFYVPRRPHGAPLSDWAESSADVLDRMLGLESDERMQLTESGQTWAARFAQGSAIERYLAEYQRVLDMPKSH